MGIDATLFALSPYSCMGIGLVAHVFSLHRDRDLWGPLEALQRSGAKHPEAAPQEETSTEPEAEEGRPEEGEALMALLRQRRLT